jgi:hypothetical protein
MSTIIPTAGNLTVILSAELDWRDDARNALDHDLLRQGLADQLGYGELLSVQVCRGAYKGSPERSIAITGIPGRVMAIARRQGERFDQESILAVDHHGQGKLYFMANTGDSHSTIGAYQACSPGGADAWTEVLATGECFTFA